MQGRGALRVAGVKRAIGQLLLDGLLLGLQRGDAVGQLLQLALLLVAQLLLGGGGLFVFGRSVAALAFCGRCCRGCGRCVALIAQGLAALGLLQPVFHAAFKFAPHAVAFVGNGAGDHVVQKGAVVADEEHGARVVLQQFFQQVDGFDVQVVGGLVQHQHGGGAGEQAGQQQAVALAAREGPHGRMRAGGREQKVAQVAAHMLALPVDLDPLAAGADEVFQRGVQVNRVAQLVEVGHLQVGAAADGAAVGFQLAQNHLEQRGLARAVGAQQANLVAAQQRGAEVAGNHLVAKGFAHVLQLGNDLALVVAVATGAHFHLHLAHHIAAGGAGFAQLFQAANAALAAGAARFHALAHPHFFLRQQLVSLGIDDGFLRQLLFLLQAVGGKVAGVRAQLAPVQLDDAGGNAVQKRPVVGDGDHAALEVDEQIFQPADGVQVQVVGGLIEQQHIGPGHQRLGQGHALFGAAREVAHAGVGVQVQALQGFFHALLPVPGVGRFDLGLQGVQVHAIGVGQVLFAQGNHPGQPGRGRLEDGGVGVQCGFLLHKGDAGALLHLQRAVVGLGQPAQNFEQRRLARAVAADQADAFIGFKGKAGVVQQSDMPESQLGIE